MNASESGMTDMDSQQQHVNPPAWPSPGQMLCRLREERGLSQGRVADALHMTAHYVNALENDEYQKLPGKTFVKGYFRSYAKLLGADIDEVMACYDRYCEALEESVESKANNIRARKADDQNVRWLICAAVIIVIVVGLSWWFAHKRQEDSTAGERQDSARVIAANRQAYEQETAIDDTVTAENLVAGLSPQDTEESPIGQGPTPADESAPENLSVAVDEAAQAGLTAGMPETGAQDTASGTADAGISTIAESGTQDPAVDIAALPDYTIREVDDSRIVSLESEGQDILRVEFNGDSWIEVDNSDSTRLYHDMLGTGDELTIRGKAPFNVLVGDANMVDITFNARSINVQRRMRSDNSARILLAPEAGE